jgi:hypothetical protein
MDSPTTQDSTKFPPGYGDFALQCSDGIVCHFPRYLLGYMSGFFRDMFSLPEGVKGQSPTPSEPLKVTETGEIIDLLLQHIDPRTKNPDIDPNTVVSLLEAARKYQVVVVTEWFEEEIKLRRVIIFVEDALAQSPFAQMEPLLVTNPLLVLYCAFRFDLPRPGQLALREITQCNEALLQSTDHDLPLHVYLHGMDLRNKRVELFKAFITELAALETDSRGARTSWSGSSRGRGAHTPLSPVKRAGGRDNERKTCVGCTATRASWILRTERAVREEPNWRALVAAYDRNVGKCSHCETSSWADYHRGLLQTWESRTAKTQRELPAWPL